MAEWFSDWFNSPFYHKLYFERDQREAAAFIDKLIHHLAPSPTAKMLDIACGKGRHALQLNKLGFDVTGIDLATASIEQANRFSNESLRFYVHDMRLPFYINYFDYAFNFFTSFGYFRTQRENDDAIRSISRSLQPNGVFTIDYLNTHYIEDRLVPEETKVINGTSYQIKRWFNDTHFFKQIIVEDPSLPGPMQHQEQVAKFSLGDFNDMLSYQGLQIQEVYGNYQLERYHIRNTPRLIAIARKIR